MHRGRFFFQRWIKLWQICPLVFWGLHLAFLAHLLVDPSTIPIVCFTLLWLSKKITKQDVLLAVFFSLTFFLHLHFFHHDRHRLLSVQELEISGEGIFRPEHYIERKTLVREQTFIKGKLLEFGSVKNIPATLDIKKNTSLDLSCAWKVIGTVKICEGQGKIKALSIEPQKERPALAQIRYNIKSRYKKFLGEIFSKDTAELFYTLFTGEITSASLNAIFSKTGQKQMLVVSGLHFALLGAVLYFLLSFLLPLRFNLAVTLGILSLYFLWIGYSPAVCRAYVGLAFYTFSILFMRPLHPLQGLGIAMTLQGLLDPLAPLDLGFQLSYLATASIILLAKGPSLHKVKRALYLQAAIQLSTAYPLLQQIGYIPTVSFFISLYFPALLSVILFTFLLFLPLAILSLPLAKIIYFPLDCICSCNLELLKVMAIRFPHLSTSENFFTYVLVAVLVLFFGYRTSDKNFFIEKCTQY